MKNESSNFIRLVKTLVYLLHLYTPTPTPLTVNLAASGWLTILQNITQQ